MNNLNLYDVSDVKTQCISNIISLLILGQKGLQHNITDINNSDILPLV